MVIKGSHGEARFSQTIFFSFIQNVDNSRSLSGDPASLDIFGFQTSLVDDSSGLMNEDTNENILKSSFDYWEGSLVNDSNSNHLLLQTEDKS